MFFYCARVCLKIISAACITRNFQFRKFLSVNSNLCYTVVTVLKGDKNQDTMNDIYTTYLQIIKNNFIKTGRNTNQNHTPSGESFAESFQREKELRILPEDISALSVLAGKHFTSPFLLPYVKSNPQVYTAFKQQTKQMMFQYYQIEHLTEIIVSLMNREQIPYYLLKGISLAAYYPVPEYRKLGDVDLYIPDPAAFEKAKKVLEANGFVLDPELSDHHTTYIYTFPKTGRRYILELHFRIVGVYQYDKANQIVDQVFSKRQLTPELQKIGDLTYRVLPPTEYTFYMIHHMLKHYLYSGFGIRLLCDFVLYLTARNNDIDFDKLHQWCKESKILHFYEIIIETLHLYLGLPADIEPDIHYPSDTCDTFIQRILEDHDMGTSNDTALVGSGSYAKVNFWTYFKEGHLQMKVRFPKLHKCVILWPVLWGITFVCFIWNTYHYRHTTFKETLEGFKKTNEDSQLIKIFENEDV